MLVYLFPALLVWWGCGFFVWIWSDVTGKGNFLVFIVVVLKVVGGCHFDVD